MTRTPISSLPYRTPSLEARFWAKVAKSDGCWTWTASTCGRGYGQFFIRKARNPNGTYRPYMALAHRVAYELCVGPIPVGLTIDHICGNIRCVNPDHLDAVSQLENNRRSIPHNSLKETCPRGHPYDDTYSWTEKRSGRYKTARICTVCKREFDRQRWIRRRDVVRAGRRE